MSSAREPARAAPAAPAPGRARRMPAAAPTPCRAVSMRAITSPAVDAIAFGDLELDQAPADFGRDAHVGRLDIAGGARLAASRGRGGRRRSPSRNDTISSNMRCSHAIRPSRIASVTRWMCATTRSRGDVGDRDRAGAPHSPADARGGEEEHQRRDDARPARAAAASAGSGPPRHPSSMMLSERREHVANVAERDRVDVLPPLGNLAQPDRRESAARASRFGGDRRRRRRGSFLRGWRRRRPPRQHARRRRRTCRGGSRGRARPCS